MTKRILSLILALTLVLGLCLPAQAADTAATEAADALNTLGLFNGVGTNADGTPNYALDRAPTRQEGITMLVRLLGKEADALAGDWDIPFTDVDEWAVPYVGYAYSAGLTRGTGETTFGSKDTLTASQYITFVLRALGWSSDTDFAWDRAWEKSDELGITDGSYGAQNNAAFLRGDVVIISVGAMNAAVKGGEGSLLDTLIAAGAVTQAAAEESGLLPDAYIRFARELLAMEYTEVTIPFGGEKHNAISTTMLLPHVGQQDFYIARGDAQSTVAAEAESMLRLALIEYAEKCMDGDYRNNDRMDFGVSTITMNFTTPTCMLVTNRNGMVVGYALWGAGDTEFTLRLCRKDSTALMDSVAAKTNAMLDSLPRIEGTIDVINGEWVFNFTDLPENAVWARRGGTSYRYATAIGADRYDVRDELVSLYNVMRQYPQYNVQAEKTLREKTGASWDKPGTLRAVILFLDADMQPVAYAYVSREF